MARLPTPDSDDGSWGTLLNEFLSVGHNGNGTLKGVQSAYNVRDYGATGDGTTNDTEAFARAIASIPNTGGLLYIPSGVYTVSNIIFDNRTDITTLGAGTASVIAPTRGNTAIIYRGCQRCHLGFLQIDGGINDGTIGISITGNFDAKFSNIFITNMTGDGVYVNGDGLNGNGTEIELGNVTCRDNGGYGYHYTRSTLTDTGGMYLTNCRMLYNTRGAGGVRIESSNARATSVFHVFVDLVADNYRTPAISLHNIAHCRFTRAWAGGSTNLGMIVIDGNSYMVEIDGAYIVNGNRAGYNVLINDNVSGLMLDNIDLDGSPASHVHIGSDRIANIFFGDYQIFGSSPLTDTLVRLYKRSGFTMQRGPMVFETDSLGGFSTSVGIDDIRNPGKQKWFRNANGTFQILNTTFNSGILEVQDSGQIRWNEGSWISKHLSGTTVWTPGTIANGTQVHTTVPVPGARVGDTVASGFSVALPAGMLISGAVTEPGTITVTVFNASGTAHTLGSGILRADAWQH